jgi:hypothetical protein
MWSSRCSIVFLALTCLLAGCRAEALLDDQRSMRNLLLQTYQDEVLDNIVRTSLHLPIMDFVYSNVTGTATNTNVATLAGGPTDTITHAATPTHTWQYMLSLNNANTSMNQLTVTGSPVFDTHIYDAYRNFVRAGTAEEQYRLRYVAKESEIPRDAFLWHYFRYRDEDRYYYIPSGNELEFEICYEKVTTTALAAHAAKQDSIDSILNEQTLQRLSLSP